MKVTLDLTDLVAKGQLTKEEADRLAKLGSADTGALGSNILLAFGTVAVALGGGFLFPTAPSVIVMGTILFVLGLALIVNKAEKWALFAQFCVTLGALGIVGGVSYIANGDPLVGAGLVVGLAVAAAVAQSGLLAALTILQLALVLGAGTAYWHASYFFGADRPAVTIAALAAATLGLFFVSLRVPAAYERVCIIGARTAILLINLVFLIGSLFGDSTFADRGLTIPAGVFTIVWAVLLLGVGVWGVYANRRWVVNAAAVFGALHFYTQWFEYLGPNPLAVLGAGILLVVFGLLLRWINGRIYKPKAAVPAAA